MTNQPVDDTPMTDHEALDLLTPAMTVFYERGRWKLSLGPSRWFVGDSLASVVEQALGPTNPPPTPSPKLARIPPYRPGTIVRHEGRDLVVRELFGVLTAAGMQWHVRAGTFTLSTTNLIPAPAAGRRRP